jgi:hypothetical protein
MPVEPCEGLDLVATDVVDAALEVHRHLGPAFAESSSPDQPKTTLAAWRLGGRLPNLAKGYGGRG